MAIGYVVLAVLLVAGYWLWTTGDTERRLTGLTRLVLGVPFFALLFFLGGLYGAFLVLIFVLDTLWEIVTGRPGISPETRLKRLEEWRAENTTYLVYGQGDPRLIP